jgi:putative acetyltransferase
MESASRFPRAVDESLVGTYPALTRAGGGYVWDAVLEYRVWCHPLAGAPHVEEDDDYFRAFSTCEDALAFAERTEGAEEPLALVLQEEYIDEPAPQHYVHVRERRTTEWSIDFLNRPRRTPRTIPDFIASNAPNRLDILRGLA